MNQPDLPEPDLTEDERLFLASLTRPLTEDESQRLQASPIGDSSSLTQTWLAMAAFGETDEIQAMRREALAAGAPARRQKPQWPLPVGIAAAMAIAVTGVALSWHLNAYQTFTAPARGITHIALADGTQVTLSAGGEIRSRIGRTRRDIDLTRGDAYFAVVHDAARPLTVTSGIHRIVDLGTEFNIAQTATAYRVTLVSGALRISNTHSGYSRVLAPGQSYVEMPTAEQVVQDPSPHLASWAHGQLVFEDASLDQVGSAFTRVTGRRIIFDTPALSDMRLSGTIDIEHVDRACVALSAALPLRARPTAEGDIRISRR